MSTTDFSNNNGNNNNSPSDERTYLYIPYEQRDEARNKGARWDPNMKKWYISNNLPIEDFNKWLNIDTNTTAKKTIITDAKVDYSTPVSSPIKAAQDTSSSIKSGRNYLDVPFDQRESAKQKGARWDAEAKKWYVPEFSPMEPFIDWIATKDICYLNVSYDEKDDAKELGARWNNEMKKWYVPSNVSKSLFRKWWIDHDTATTFVTPSSPKRSDHESNNNTNELVMFIDIETNGLPTIVNDEFPSYFNISSYDTSRIIQVSLLLCDPTTLNPLHKQTYLIKSDGFPIDNTQFHGITLQQSLTDGKKLIEVMEDFNKNYLSNTKLILAHNAKFDLNVLKSELYRYKCYDILNKLETIQTLCTMELTKPILGLLNKIGKLKNPSLLELYRYVTHIDITNHHDAEFDVKYLHEAIKQLFDENKIKF